jgi:AraC-like DNA-binding protein
VSSLKAIFFNPKGCLKKVKVNHFFDIFIVGGFFCSLLTSLVLFFSGRHQVPANRFLAVVFLAMAWFVFQYILVPEDGTLRVPEIIRTGYPFSFLAPPFAYFYVRSLLLQDTRLRKKDWLHLIPAGIGLLDLGAYFMGSTPAEQDLLHLVTGNDRAFFSARISLVPVLSTFLFLPVQALLYLLLQWRLLLRHLRPGVARTSFDWKGTATWLLAFTLVLTLIYCSIALEVFIQATNELETTFFISLCLLGVSVYLFFNPQMLYGTLGRFPAPINQTEGSSWALAGMPAAGLVGHEAQWPFPENDAPPVPAAVVETYPGTEAGGEAEAASERSLLMSPEQVAFYAGELKNYLAASEMHRKQGISINDLAVALQIPARQLSYVINQHYRQRFTDLINSYRVEYIIDRLQKDDWRALTLEGLAAEAGFSSRSTFFTSFKKVTSLNPTQFLQQLSKVAG